MLLIFCLTCHFDLLNANGLFMDRTDAVAVATDPHTRQSGLNAVLVNVPSVYVITVHSAVWTSTWLLTVGHIWHVCLRCACIYTYPYNEPRT